jgi:Domain of unknown function (DUF4157)
VETPRIRARRAPVPRPSAVPANPVPDVLREPGQPLPAPLKSDMEARFGTDLSGVRLHTGAAARDSAAAIGARAFTAANHVVVGSGGADALTLGHELAHVVQQREGPVSGADNGSGLMLSDPSDRFERAAEAVGRRVAAGLPARTTPDAGASGAPGSRAPSVTAGPAPPGAACLVQRSVRVVSPRSGPQGARPATADEIGNFLLGRQDLDELAREVEDPAERGRFKNAMEDLRRLAGGLSPGDQKRLIEYAMSSPRDFDIGVPSVAAIDEWMRTLSLFVTREQEKPSRPPAKHSRHVPDNAKTEAMEKSQKLNDSDVSRFEENVKLLQGNPKGVFYVIGKSAMGQGDTAFIVRTVKMLRSIGLKAFGVKQENAAHAPGTSFNKTLDYITPEELMKSARPGDFIIEGPLSDPVSLKDPKSTTWFDTVAPKFQDNGKDILNLRLYEYGTLSYRGGQQLQQPNPANVVHYAGDPRHAFMGMGHGEIGAFYNADEGREPVPLEAALAEHAKTSRTVERIQAVLREQPKARIFIGYANSRRTVYAWANAVHLAMSKDSSVYSLIVAVYGGDQRLSVKFAIRDDVHILDVIDREKGARQQGVSEGNQPGKASGSIILTDTVPSAVMSALQRRASPFTLATGNYSLSEAIEHGHMATYEKLDFNAGVETAYQWQLQNAMENLKVDKPLQDAVMALMSPVDLERKTAQIQLILAHPDMIERIMREVRVSTDITRLLAGRLAALVRAAMGPK